MILQYPILFLTVIVPMVASFLQAILGRNWKPKVHTTVSTVLLLLPLAVISALIVQTGLKEPVADTPFFRSDVAGNFTMLLDGLNAPIAFSIGLITAFVSLYSLPYMEHRLREMEHEGEKAPSWGVYYMLYVMFSSAMLGTVFSTNLLEFYLFLELSLLPSFLLIAFYGYGEKSRIAIMYLIWTHVGALVFLAGALVVGLTTGVFDIINPDTLAANMALGEKLPESMRMIVTVALTIGLFVKMAVFGVHIWLPYAHAEAPTPVSALLSPNLIGIAGYALIRINYTLFPKSFPKLTTYTLPLALLTMIYGGLMVLAQKDFKRLLAYSSISQMGYILLGVSSLQTFGVAGAMLHYASHAVGKALLFMVAGTLIAELHGLRRIDQMGGLASKMPHTAAMALAGFMNITGVPPSLGFWSEVLIIWGVVEKAFQTGSFIPTVAGLVVAIGLSTGYAFVTMKRVFYGEPCERAGEAEKASRSLIIPMAIIAAVGVVLFIIPYIFIDPLVKFLELYLKG